MKTCRQNRITASSSITEVAPIISRPWRGSFYHGGELQASIKAME
jgi:hypothetical protein